MGANPGPPQIIRREAVEDSAEKPLDVVVDLSLQTEKRMRGHDPAGTIAAIRVSRLVGDATSR